MTVTLNSRKDFTLANFRRVAAGGEAVKIGPAARRAMASARKSFIALLDSDRTQFIYGTTSGAGPQAKVAIPPAEQRRRANQWRVNRQHGSGFGGGDLPERVVRGVVFARLANFIEGNAKTRPVIAERIASMLRRPMPALPASGQVGAGEILPLAHVMSAMPDGDMEEGEPMALINGSPVSAAMAADAAAFARPRLELAEQVFALSIEAMSAPMEAYDPDLVHLWGDPYEGEAIRRINSLLAGNQKKGRRFYQAPVSWRILPRVLGAARRAIATMEDVAEISLSSVTDNPVYVLPDRKHPLGRAISTGGYHNGAAYPAIDAVNAAFADLVTLADHHTTKMQNADVSGLPPGLVRPGAEGRGTGGLGFIQIGFGEEARHAAQRTFLPPSEGGGYGQNDVASPTAFAFQKHMTANRCLDSAMAILAVVASQAFHATDRQAPRKLRDTLAAIRAIVPPYEGARRRNRGKELEALRDAFAGAVESGDLLRPKGRTAARKTPAKKTAARKSPAKKTSAKKATAKRKTTARRKSPARKAAARSRA
ncbi:MAG: aromatic amino acid lyase [Alphaproteobacteria bacterium]